MKSVSHWVRGWSVTPPGFGRFFVGENPGRSPGLQALAPAGGFRNGNLELRKARREPGNRGAKAKLIGEIQSGEWRGLSVGNPNGGTEDFRGASDPPSPGGGYEDGEKFKIQNEKLGIGREGGAASTRDHVRGCPRSKVQSPKSIRMPESVGICEIRVSLLLSCFPDSFLLLLSRFAFSRRRLRRRGFLG